MTTNTDAREVPPSTRTRFDPFLRKWLYEGVGGWMVMEPQPAEQDERAQIVAWLRERAEKQLFAEPDPEQPGFEEQHYASRTGAYNALHLSALRIERGDHLKEPGNG